MAHQDATSNPHRIPARRSPGPLCLLLLVPTAVLLAGCPGYPMPGCRHVLVARVEAESFDPLQDRWVGFRDLPTAVGGARAVVIGGDVYVVGGQTRTSISSPELYRYDQASSRWRKLDDMPSARSRHAAVAVGNDIYVLGGTGGPGFVEVYDTTVDAWRIDPDMPNDHDWFDAVLAGTRIFAIGGGNDLLDALETTTGNWTSHTPLPGPLSGMAAATDGTSIFVIGGHTPGEPGPPQSDSVSIYDVATDSWAPGPAVPEVGHFFRSAHLDGKVYLFGAYGPPSNGRVPVGPVGEDRQSVWVLDVVTRMWSPGADKPGPFFEVAVAVDATRLHLFGGWTIRRKGCG